METKEFTIKINNVETTALAGTTIIEAALSVGIDIPHLCYYRGLPPTAACRLCVVEVEGSRNLVASCAAPVSEGMVVRTNTERVQAAQRLVMDLILSDHPLDCLTCEKAGSCLLERYAYQMGIKGTSFHGERHQLPVDRSNPFFLRDLQKCILCGRCVNTCHEIHRMVAVDFSGKGFDTRVTAAFDRSLMDSPCTFCGNCVQVCPTGALTEYTREGKGREWEFTRAKSVCPYCGCGCGLELYSRDGKLVRVMGDEDNPVNRGWLCVKGRFGFDFVNHPDRLTTPLICNQLAVSSEQLAVSSEQVAVCSEQSTVSSEQTPVTKHHSPTTWDAALEFTARRLTEIKDKYGPDSIAILASAKCTNEENYLMQKFARTAIGTNNVDHCARLCHASTVSGLALAFGSGAMTNSIHELRNAQSIFVIGSNTTETHPLVAVEIKAAVQDRGASLIVCDPRQIELTAYASHWLRHRPGTDVALINAMLKILLDEGLIDQTFIDTRTEGFADMAEALKDCTPEWAEAITGVSSADLRSAARTFGKADRGAIIYAMGITQHTTGTDNVLALANLALATGNLGRESCGVNPLRGQNNVQGSCDMGGLPTDFPGYQKVSDPTAKEKFEKAWGTRLPETRGLTLVEMMHAAETGEIKAMVIMGENPAITDPNTNAVRRALANLEFLCVTEMFETETTEFAHVVLPAVSFAEKTGTWTNTERRVQLFGPAIPPLERARSDGEIVCDLAQLLGASWTNREPEDVFDEMAALTPQYAGMSHARLREESLQWPCPTRSHPGTPTLHREKFTRGLGKFHPLVFRPAAELPDEDYPFVFTTGRQLYQYHSGTMSRRSPGIEKRQGKPVVSIHPVDAKQLGIDEGRQIRIISRRGEVQVPAEITEQTAPGTLFMPFHFHEAIANLVTNDALDPVARIPELKVCAVKISID